MASNTKSALLDAANRPVCSIPLMDADFALNNSNWTKGLQAMSNWIWSANINPVEFPNNLGRFFLQIPGTFEQQLNYSTSLIFDEPSFKNGIQVSGFVDRVAKELAISTIAQTRRCWYTLSHHAILGKLTSVKHNLTDTDFTNKWINLLDHTRFPAYYTTLEHEIIDFAISFATDPKKYADDKYALLKKAFVQYNNDNYTDIEMPMLKLKAARDARAEAILAGTAYEALYQQYLLKMPSTMPLDMMERKVNGQLVELTFLCLQFVALSAAFTGLNISDEDFLPGVLQSAVSNAVIDKINEYCQLGLNGDVPPLQPPAIPELDANGIVWGYVRNGTTTRAPVNLKGTGRIPLTPYEGKDAQGNFRPAFSGATDTDKGLTVGGVQVGVYGWGFGGHFPGSLVYCLMNHPELARFEAPYSLPVLFNEDEWRNGVNTGGYTSRRLRELVIQKIYRTNRSRYGLEHHIMFLYNSYLDEYGVGRNPNTSLSPKQVAQAKKNATAAAEIAALFVHDHLDAPAGVFSALESAVLTWTDTLLKRPHQAFKDEGNMRNELQKQNQLEIDGGVRILDLTDNIGSAAGLQRLINHQVCELVMLIGHMDGLGRAMTILQLEAEDSVGMVLGSQTATGGIKPDLNAKGEVQFTGYYNNRPALHNIYGFLSISSQVQTLNELFLDPVLCQSLVTSKGDISKAKKSAPEF